MEVTYGAVTAGANPNEFITSFTTTGQTYGVAGFYGCTSLTTDMWTSNSANGYVFSIKTITNATAYTCDVVLLDVCGENALLDTSTAANGAPSADTIGYVFQLNEQNLPVLTNTPLPPTNTWAKSIL